MTNQVAHFFVNFQNTVFQASQKKPLLGVHGCSIGQAKADACEVIVAIIRIVMVTIL